MKQVSPRIVAGLFLAGALSSAPAAAQSVDWTQIIGAILGGQVNSQQNPQGNLATCGSTNNQTQTCNVPNGYYAEFVRQVSQAPCIQGRTMYLSANQITVTQGCRAEFRILPGNYGNYPGGNYPGNNYPGNYPGYPGGAWARGTMLTLSGRAALERAIENDLRRQYRNQNVQVETNTLYEQQALGRNEYVIRGRFGVSVNDGNWDTRSFEARMRQGASAVSGLRIDPGY